MYHPLSKTAQLRQKNENIFGHETKSQSKGLESVYHWNSPHPHFRMGFVRSCFDVKF